MRPKIEWPDGKKICATLTVAFEKMIRYVRQHDDVVWLPTRDEIADYVLANTNSVEPYSAMG
jgi:hypothetical protein